MCLEVTLISRNDWHFLKNDCETLRHKNGVPRWLEWSEKERMTEWSERERVSEWVTDK